MSANSSPPLVARRLRAYSVHVLTASGVVLALLSIGELFSSQPDLRWVFGYLGAAIIIDAVDGSLAREWDVLTYAASTEGHTLDDLVDYLTFTFIPLVVVWQMNWLVGPTTLWIAAALMASLFGFSHADAKQTETGFFRGFPSYWNLVAYHIGLIVTAFPEHGPLLMTGLVITLAILTVVPIQVLYPTRTPRPWRRPVLWGAVVWALLLAAMLPTYPNIPAWGDPWLLPLSLLYPLFYAVLSYVAAYR